MTIEERDTARAIQTIARELKKPAPTKEIDWEQRKWEIAKELYVQDRTGMSRSQAIFLAEQFIEDYKKSQTNKTE